MLPTNSESACGRRKCAACRYRLLVLALGDELGGGAVPTGSVTFVDRVDLACTPHPLVSAHMARGVLAMTGHRCTLGLTANVGMSEDELSDGGIKSEPVHAESGGDHHHARGAIHGVTAAHQLVAGLPIKTARVCSEQLPVMRARCSGKEMRTRRTSLSPGFSRSVRATLR